jgi:aspartyl/asparaginyl beta-hydroxylase (cupin superfamily)
VTTWIEDTVTSLERWAAETGAGRASIARVLDGLDITGNGTISKYAGDQRPTVFVPGLTAKPFWETASFAWAKKVEEATQSILRELEDNGWVQSAEVSNHLTGSGRWSVRYLTCIGRPDRYSFDAFPVTMRALQAAPGSTSAGMTYFSAVETGTHILPHYGFTNAHLRCHLTLAAADGSQIRVGPEVREWENGRLLVFDDTFEHEVFNNSETSRLVLLFDIFHPDLDAAEVRSLNVMMETYRRHFMRSYLRGLASEDEADGRASMDSN